MTNERICTICKAEPITADPAKYPDTDFCRYCYANGLHEQRRLSRRGLIERLELAGATSANVWQTGGGCMVLAIRFADGSLFTASHDDGPSIPEIEGPWGGYLALTDDAWQEGDTEEHLGLGDDDGLVAFVAQQAYWRNRYRYEFFKAEDGATAWERRAQWLIFDRKGLGCMASFGVERDAARVVAALNAFEQTNASLAYDESAWTPKAVV